MATDPDIVVQEVEYHRNGVGGIGFHVVRFMDFECGNMVATVFPAGHTVAVLCVDKLAAGDIRFGSNSYRGDRYEPLLRDAIKRHKIAKFGTDED